MPSRIDSEIRTLQKDLQYFVDGLVEYGDRESKLAKRIYAYERPRLFGAVIPGISPRSVTRRAWMTFLPKDGISKEVLWAKEPITGITFDGMLAQCWILPVVGSTGLGAIPELHLVRASECKEAKTLNTLIQLAKDILAS